ncbi:ABC transporter ATP-binding protein [Streptomyces goshikiensis]|uniref:ABC transporter ATP-binding protein n=1 Tax=Streptomyces TaxID=1883 RepID=UPI000F3A94EE|nr:ABC transporter ATP-binding protein [Streptomyces sp. ADI95-16]AYV32448.1 Daunorubicin/doxorubicin resistance ATP-binding protein DrrA [Streptomyces sp. ADI95-16]
MKVNDYKNDVVIDVRDVRRTYGVGSRSEYEAVRGVSLQVRRGEVFALLGTNGAGKTSTVELMEGLAPADSGQVRVLGHDPYRQRAEVRPLTGVMLQSGGFPADLTVAEVARFWSKCSPPARTVSEVLSLVGLTGRRTVPVKQLSGGESRRLDLALAVIGGPQVLFLDEPTTGMDPEGRRDTWDIVRQLQQDGTTVLLTTHYLEEAEELSDHLAILQKGRVVAEGTAAEVIAGQPSRISFDLPAGLHPESLPSLPGTARRQTDGQSVVLHTQDLQTVLTRLLNWAAEQHISLEGLDARTASLEEAFLAMTIGAESRPARSSS